MNTRDDFYQGLVDDLNSKGLEIPAEYKLDVLRYLKRKKFEEAQANEEEDN
jgi:hypothetical protein